MFYPYIQYNHTRYIPPTSTRSHVLLTLTPCQCIPSTTLPINPHTLSTHTPYRTSRDPSHPKNGSRSISPSKSPSEASAISAFDLKERPSSQGPGPASSRKPPLDPVKVENIRLINDQLRKIADDFQLQVSGSVRAGLGLGHG